MPVLFVHGVRTSRTMWRAQLEALDAAGIRAVAVDLPGHGLRRDEPFTLDGAVGVVREAVDALGGRAIVVGLSLGGYVAIEHRARHPEQSHGLVAAGCCTPTRTRVRDAWVLAARVLGSSPDHGVWLNQRLVDLMLDDVAARDIAAGGFSLDVMTDVLREVAKIDTLTALTQATSPVWVVNGRWDHFRGGERRTVAAARASGAPTRLVVVPHARHLVSLDAPVAFARVVLEAVAEVRAVLSSGAHAIARGRRSSVSPAR